MPTVVIDRENLKRLLNREQVEVTDLFVITGKVETSPYPVYVVLDPNLTLQNVIDVATEQEQQNWKKQSPLL